MPQPHPGISFLVGVGDSLFGNSWGYEHPSDLLRYSVGDDSWTTIPEPHWGSLYQAGALRWTGKELLIWAALERDGQRRGYAYTPR